MKGFKYMAIFTNQATLSYNGNTVNSNTVTGNIVEVLAVTKTALADTYSRGDSVTYVVSLTNSGTTALTDVTVTDNLGEYPFGEATLTPLDYNEGSIVYYINGVLQSAPVITGSSPLTVTGLSVPAGGNAILVYEATANSFAPLVAGSTITNEVSVSYPGIATPVTASQTVTVTDEPVLGITKALNPVNVSENSTLTYTFTISNTGNAAADATDNVVVTDTFNPILSAITVTLNGDILPSTAYTYDESTGVFTTTGGIITVPAATFMQDPATGTITATPGIATLTVSGTV